MLKNNKSVKQLEIRLTVSKENAYRIELHNETGETILFRSCKNLLDSELEFLDGLYLDEWCNKEKEYFHEERTTKIKYNSITYALSKTGLYIMVGIEKDDDITMMFEWYDNKIDPNSYIFFIS